MLTRKAKVATNDILKLNFVFLNQQRGQMAFFGPFLANVAIFESHFIEKKLIWL
jgi:hypothetical protein